MAVSGNEHINTRSADLIQIINLTLPVSFPPRSGGIIKCKVSKTLCPCVRASDAYTSLVIRDSFGAKMSFRVSHRKED